MTLYTEYSYNLSISKGLTNITNSYYNNKFSTLYYN